MNTEMSNAVNTLIETMVADYANWQQGSRRAGINEDILKEQYGGGWVAEAYQLERYTKGFEILVGKKYIKIANNGGVKAFIANTENDKMFPYGSILKPASWSTPARNFARGNVFEDYNVMWTGA
jgi:hypothetical protein